MRALPLLLVFLAAAPASAVDFCYFNGKKDIAKMMSVKCLDKHQAKFPYTDAAEIYDFKCGVTNTFNLLGEICEDPCKSALKGVTAHARHNRTVVFGPPLLNKGAGGFMAFGLFEGSCSELQDRLNRDLPYDVKPMTDDDLIKSASIAPPGKK